MPTRSYTVQIDINSKGARVITRDLSQLQKQATSTGSAVNFFRRALLGLTAGLGIRQIADFADQVTNLRNRLGLLTSSTTEANSIVRSLFQIAKDSRSPFDATAQVFTRMALAARTLGESNDELLKVTESLNQAVILSGTNAREAANGLIQLSQAIASNRLGGDELRSVLEQLPLVADIIGQELVRLGLAINGTRGEVRQLGFEGKITAKIIIDAFKNARAQLAADFKNTIPTIGQAVTFLATSIIELIDNFNQMSNASTGAAFAIIFLGNHLKDLLNILLLVGGAFAGVKIAAFAAGLTASVKAALAARLAFSLAAASMGVAATQAGVLVTAARALFLALGGLPALIGLIVTGLALLANANLNFFGGQDRSNKDALKESADAMKDLAKFPPEIQREVRALNAEISETSALLTDQANSWIRNDDVARSAQERQEKARKRLIELQRPGGISPGPTKDEEKRSDLLAKIIRQLNGEFAALQLNRSERERLVDLLRIEEQLRGKGFEGQSLQDALAQVDALLKRNQAEAQSREILDGLLAPQEKLTEALSAYQRVLATNPEFTDQASRAITRLRIEALEPATDAFSGLRRAALEQSLEFTNAAENSARAYREITDPARQYQATVMGLNAVLAEFPSLQSEVNQKLIEARIVFLETQKAGEAGIERGLLKIQQQLSDTASLTENALTTAFNDAKESLLDFFTTGKLSMTDFVNHLQRSLADLALSGLLNQTLGAALGLGGQNSGGIASFISSIFGGSGDGGIDPSTGGPAGAGPQGPGFARGGSFMVGGNGGVDSQAVAFRATPGERVTVQTPGQQASAARDPKIIMYISTPDAQSFARSQGSILARGARQLDRARRRDG